MAMDLLNTDRRQHIMAEVKWVKLTTDMFDNRKVKHLRRLPEGNNIVLIWVMLLTMAGRCNSGGMIFLTENIPYTPKMLADELDFEENTVLLAIQALEQLDMIVTENGFFAIAGWEEYQNADKLAEIRAKDRERKRLKRAQAKALLGESEDVHGMSTECPHIEEEEEKDKEKEFHSIIHSAESEEDLSDPEYRRRYLGGIGKNVVFLSDEQMSDLLDKMSVEEFDYYVGVVADSELKGHHYKKKTHYQAILEMANKDRRTK
jgi:predicted phage replisome organizer